METVKGSISRILFSSEDTGYKVLNIKTTSGSPLVITGEFGPEMVKDTVANFHGDYTRHPKYGYQFRAFSSDVVHNAEEMTAIQLFLDNIAPNIGEGRADAIVKHFGSDTVDILEGSPEKLLEVDGIGKVSAASLSKAWEENKETWTEQRQVYSLRAFLYSLGLKEKRVKRILAFFGGGLEAEERIRENPYILAEIEGFGFSTADYIARKLSVPESSPYRIRAFVLHLLSHTCLNNGHLYLTKKDLVALCNQFSNDNDTHFLGKNNIGLDDIEDLLGDEEFAVKVEEEDGIVYSRAAFRAESSAASFLAATVSEPSDLIFLTKEAIEEHTHKFEKENRIELSGEQKAALHHFAEHKVFVITGAPGTGKTTVLKAIVQLAQKMHLRLTCMTPTGISAKKLATTVGYEAYTIHRRLGFRGNEWTCDELNPYETDVVIVDETSMVDQEVFYRLMAALKKRVHIIFVGDQDQLPSVGAGNVLKELIACEEIPVVRLETIFRQSEASDIIKVAHKIKHGDSDLDLFKPDPKADVFFYREMDTDVIEKFIVGLATRFKNERRLFQIITPRNEGPLSVSMLNELLQKVLNPPSPELAEMNMGFFVLRKGDRVMIRKNDYERDVYNGDIGKVTIINKGNLSVEVDGRVVPFTQEEALDKIRLAYTISVHKSQGGEYPYVILPFINQFGKRLLQRNLLYTALTRAKEKVIVMGHGSALERAINNASVTKRNTKLAERIKQCLALRRRPSLLLLPTEQQDSLIATKEEEQPSSREEDCFPTAATEK